jgi:hypothetical protein
MSEYTYISGNTKVVELQGDEAESVRRGSGIGALTEKIDEILEKMNAEEFKKFITESKINVRTKEEEH